MVPRAEHTGKKVPVLYPCLQKGNNTLFSFQVLSIWIYHGTTCTCSENIGNKGWATIGTRNKAAKKRTPPHSTAGIKRIEKGMHLVGQRGRKILLGARQK
mmetsp:Transcript_121205/g.210768  ORF Transcript_121205/g.210768 Transcript_121205/m.210768 type:complete len:100 (-) Transcript_121205:615-914(-)